MIFDALVVGYVRGNALRALISIVAIAFGVATALALSLASSFTVTTLDSDRALFTHHLDFQIAPYTNGVPQGVLARVRYLDGVDTAEPIIDRPVVLGVDARSGKGGLATRLIGTDLLQPLPGVTGFEEGLPGPFEAVGTFIDPAAVIDTNGAIVTAETARRFHLARGAAFALLVGSEIVPMRVANILPASAQGVDSSTLFVDITTAQNIFHTPFAFDRIDIVTDVPAESVRPLLASAIGDRARLVDPEADAASLANLTAGIDATFGALAVIAFAIGGLLVFNAVGTSITQRRGDIGTLRALGVAPHQIVAAFALEGTAYGAIGAAFGIGLGIAAMDALAGALHAGLPGIEHHVGTLGGVFAIGTVVATICAVIPALRATGLAPGLAARQGAFERIRGTWRAVASAVVGAAFLAGGVWLGIHPSHDNAFVLGFPLCFAAGGTLMIPAFLRALSSFARRFCSDAAPAVRLAALVFGATPHRIGVALAALAIAVFASVAFDINSRSFESALATWADRSIAGDLIVKLAGSSNGSEATLDRGALVRTLATPGVRSVAAIRTLHVRSGSTDVALRGEDDFKPVPRVETTEAPAELSAQLAARLHADRGSSLDLEGPEHHLRVRVVDVRPDFSDGRGAIVVARRLLAENFGDDRIDSLRVTLDAGRDPATVRDAVTRRLAPLRVAISTTREVRDRLESVFGATFGFARALGNVIVAIAVFGIVSALAALVFERRHELRMLRRLGASRGAIGGMLLLEAFTIASSAAALGLVLGVALASVLLDGADPVTLGFALPMDAPFGSIAITLVSSVAAATLGTVLSLPSAARIATDASGIDAA